MTNVELLAKIKAEIERRMIELAKDKYIDLHDTLCRTKELNLLLSFLDTLEEKSEKPMNLDLEKKIGSYMSNKWKFGCVIPITPVVLPNFTTEDLKDIARHFAKWGAEHLKK